MASRKRTFYLNLTRATEPVLDTVLELVEREQAHVYQRAVAAITPAERVWWRVRLTGGMEQVQEGDDGRQ